MPRSLFVLAMLLGVLAPTVPTTAASASFQEGWEAGTSGWTFSGTGSHILCSDPTQGCSLNVEPNCCSAPALVTHALSIPLSGRIALDLMFRPNSTDGDIDSSFSLGLDAGQLIYQTTEGYNNGLRVITDQQRSTFAYYDSPGIWMHLRLLVDGDKHVAQAQWLNDTGGVRRASPSLSFSASATTITSITIDAVTWGPGSGFAYDDISIGPTTACFAPSASISHFGRVLTHYEVAFDLAADVGEGCDAMVDWSVDFGDGGRAAGTSPLPKNVTHTFETIGFHTVTLDVGLASGAHLRDTLRIYALDGCTWGSVVDISGPSEVRVGANATFHLTTQLDASCAALSAWSVDFGDNTTRSEAGTPPENLTHAYAARGYGEVRYQITLTDGQVMTSRASVHVFDVRLQYANRSALAEASPAHLVDEGFVVLQAIAKQNARLTLTFDSPVRAGDVDGVFYDAGGQRMNAQPCMTMLTSEDCAAPFGAAFVKVEARGVLLTWRLVYAYRVD